MNLSPDSASYTAHELKHPLVFVSFRIFLYNVQIFKAPFLSQETAVRVKVPNVYKACANVSCCGCSGYQINPRLTVVCLLDLLAFTFIVFSSQPTSSLSGSHPCLPQHSLLLALLYSCLLWMELMNKIRLRCKEIILIFRH